MRYLNLPEILFLYRRLMEDAGGLIGIRDWNLPQSAVAQPRMSFEGEDLYPSVRRKAAALGFSLVMNHPMVDGNKRLAHASMELFLMLNGYEIDASVEEQESVMLALASGDLSREEFVNWLEMNVIEMQK
jgi:death-on-curing protein